MLGWIGDEREIQEDKSCNELGLPNGSGQTLAPSGGEVVRPPNGMRLSCAAVLCRSQMQFYYDGAAPAPAAC